MASILTSHPVQLAAINKVPNYHHLILQLPVLLIWNYINNSKNTNRIF